MSKATRNIAQIPRPYNKTPPYEVIIPIAGLGHRMKRYGSKALLTVDHEITLMQFQISMIREYLCCNPRIIIVTGFQADRVMNHVPDDIVCIENESYETTNVAKSIGMGLRASITGSVVVMYGDLVFNKYALGFDLKSESLLVIDRHGSMTANEVGCTVVDNQVEQLCYGLPQKWGQIALLKNKELELAKSICWNNNCENYFGFEVLNEIIKKGGKFTAVRPNKIKINDIDTVQDLQDINKILS